MVHLSALEVAGYFLRKLDSEAGNLLPNMPLQKLVFYAQGFALATILSKACGVFPGSE